MNEIRQLPAQSDRVETGTVQFGDDWPGIFIRGDQAAYLAMQIRDVIEGRDNAFGRIVLRGLYDTLRGCIVGPAAGMLREIER